MTDLLLVRPRSAEAQRSPELSYLSSCVLAAARQVFGTVTEVSWPDGTIDRPDLPTLVLTGENLHLGRASLESMRQALGEGAAAVVPARLSDRPPEQPVYTLRGFEALEARLPPARILDTAPEKPAVFLLARTDVGRTARDVLEGGLPAGKGAQVVEAGLYHDYVDYYGEVREDVLPFIPEGTREVLEVGCGRGVTGAFLQQRLGCRVTGVELNPEVARDAARRLDRVIVGDVMEIDLDGPGDGYDVVLATELFEHLNYPERFLATMRDVLRPGGRLVLSVPNVGHYSVVEDLLAGRWDYLPIGLLCYTHFRFFTRATLASWIERVGGFSGYEIVAQTTELPERFSTLPAAFTVDEESLRTKGFYVVVRRSQDLP